MENPLETDDSSDNITYHHLYLEDDKIILDDLSESTPIVILWMVANSCTTNLGW